MRTSLVIVEPFTLDLHLYNKSPLSLFLTTAHLWEIRECGTSNFYTIDNHYRRGADPRKAILKDLKRTAAGGKLDFFVTYDMGSTTTFQLHFVGDELVDDATAKLLPRAQVKFVDVTQPLLTPEEVKASLEYRKRMLSVVETEYSRKQRKVIPAQPRGWETDEVKVLIGFINMGLGFTKAWDTYLQHCLLFRGQGTASGKYFQLKKATYMHQHAPSTLPEIFPMLRKIREACLKAGVRVARFQNHEEYRADLIRREEFDYDSDSEDDFF